jgi:uncharacterized protein
VSLISPDANVLVYTFHQDMPRHDEYRAWLESALATEPVVGISGNVLSAAIRITTHPRIFVKPSTLPQAIGFCDFLLFQPNVVPLTPGERHWPIFTELCRRVEAKANAIPDAYLAALAIEAGALWITTDRGLAQFPGLRWKHPLIQNR